MRQGELKQVRGIGDVMCVRLSQDHGIETIAQLAALPVQLLLTDGVALDAGSALVFVGHVSLAGAEEPVTCTMRCRLQRIESDENVTFTWSGEIGPGAGMQAATIPSTSVTVPAGVYRGMFFAEDKQLASRRAFCEVPLLTVS